jgi:hypothetical protein
VPQVFFVMRKKTNQVTFLHMYHHTMMPLCGWIGVKFLPGGHGTLLGLINTLVHVIMYLYYMLAAMGPQYQKYLGWKSYVTIIQIVQFLIVFHHSSQVLVSDCDYPRPIAALLSLNALVFLYMFSSFYYHSYVAAKKRAQRAEAKLHHEAQLKEKQKQHQDSNSQLVCNGNGVVLINNNNVMTTKDANNGKLKEN